MLVPRRLGGGLRAVRRRGAALTIAGGCMCHRWRRAALRCWGSVPWHCADRKSAALRFLCFCARVLFFVFIISGRWCGWLFRWNAARPNLGPAVGCEVAFSLCTRVVWSEFVGFFFGFYFLFTFFGRKCLVSYLKCCVWPLAHYMWVPACQPEGVLIMVGCVFVLVCTHGQRGFGIGVYKFKWVNSATVFWITKNKSVRG